MPEDKTKSDNKPKPPKVKMPKRPPIDIIKGPFDGSEFDGIKGSFDRGRR